MSIILLAGFLILMLLLLFKSLLLRLVPDDNLMTRSLSKVVWFQHAGWSGLFLFLLNALLFGIAGLSLYGTTYLSVPFLHLVIMLLAVIASLYCWISIGHADIKDRKGRLFMAVLGSSFYFLLCSGCVYRMLTLSADSPEQDQFMAFIGLLMISIVTLTAWIACLIITAGNRRTAESPLQ
ncbi:MULTISPECIES: hypothetical protein [Sporosarcina]|uniref:hypothetical protein n=1 Tax=Sporosarcina TaxID=1569 RepID=UPI00129AF9D3|nr:MULTISPECIES: hypothetical protein [Sporosarcina]GKV66188.1 hypothetical protein NCCP2331_23410 [Sporosarcina sp. NCCP-2331]GLB56204.1 hypothetical protein NCCP2378_19910 [Sporosarcina sp. NCCP-2378]